MPKKIILNDKQKAFLIENYEKLTYELLCSELNICSATLWIKARELNLIEGRRERKPYLKEDEDYLMNNYSLLGPKKCALFLKRSPSCISSKARKMKLRFMEIIPISNNPENKICSECLLEKNLNEFYINYANHKQRPICISCFSIKTLNNRLKRYSTPEKIRTQTINNLFKSCKNRAISHNLPFDLTKEWIDENLQEKCPVFNFNFKLNECNGIDESLPSVDKIIPEFGYIINNCRIISLKANYLKRDGYLWEFEKVIEYIKTFKPILPDTLNKIEKFKGISKEHYYKLYYTVRNRAIAKNLDFKITFEDIKYLLSIKICPVLNISLNHIHNSEQAFSIDRVDNNLGYIKENLSVVSRRVNTLKKNASLLELESIRDYIKNNIN